MVSTGEAGSANWFFTQRVVPSTTSPSSKRFLAPNTKIQQSRYFQNVRLRKYTWKIQQKTSSNISQMDNWSQWYRGGFGGRWGRFWWKRWLHKRQLLFCNKKIPCQLCSLNISPICMGINMYIYMGIYIYMTYGYTSYIYIYTGRMKVMLVEHHKM